MKPMRNRTKELIRSLKLQPHPEGGFYAEVFRSKNCVKAKQGDRAAITTIYFLLPRGEVSRWHRVASDEVWHFVEGSPLRLHRVTADLGTHEAIRLGPIRGKLQQSIAVITAGEWQAAETTGDFSLVACDVGPGFDFADFAMLRDGAESDRLTRTHPRLVRLI